MLATTTNVAVAMPKPAGIAGAVPSASPGPLREVFRVRAIKGPSPVPGDNRLAESLRQVRGRGKRADRGSRTSGPIGRRVGSDRHPVAARDGPSGRGVWSVMTSPLLP